MALQTWFPLCIDSTMLAQYNACPRKFFRQYVQHLLGDENTDLIAGGAFARGLEVARKHFFNDNMPEWRAVQEGNIALAEKYGDHVPFGGNKTLDKMQVALESYFMEYPMGSDHAQPALLADGSYAIEYSFAHELPILHPILGVPLLFVGRADMLASYGGKLWVTDEKTTTQITKTWADQWETRGQFTGYCWGLRKDGINVAGALIRGVGILKTEIKHIETMSIRAAFEIEHWEKMMLQQVQGMVDAYKDYQSLRHGASAKTAACDIWRPAFNEACYSYFKKCWFSDSCKSANGELFLEADSEQNIWLPHLHERWPLGVYLQHLCDTEVLTEEQLASL